MHAGQFQPCPVPSSVVPSEFGPVLVPLPASPKHCLYLENCPDPVTQVFWC